MNSKNFLLIFILYLIFLISKTSLKHLGLSLSYSSPRILSSLRTYYKPVIGIYGSPDPENNDHYINGTYYVNSYILWLQDFGAEVMAIHYWYDQSTIDEILSKVNGILFMGGSRDFKREGIWEQKATYIINKSIETQLPLWGSCQGFQLIGTVISDNYTFLQHNYEDMGILHSLELTKDARGSQMYQLFTEKDFESLEKKNSTIYFHNFGFLPEDWKNEKKINDLLKVTSISKDIYGSQFVNSFEGKNESIKIFATQFHPEKTPYKRYNYPLEHSMEVLKVSQLLGMKFVDVTRNNKNRFKSRNNNEGDRKKFDFFDTYQGNPNAFFDKDSGIYSFSKNQSKI